MMGLSSAFLGQEVRLDMTGVFENRGVVQRAYLYAFLAEHDGKGSNIF
jgi:hypothetical protein